MPTPTVLLVAVIVPVATLLALRRLSVGLRDLEQTADELVELRRTWRANGQDDMSIRVMNLGRPETMLRDAEDPWRISVSKAS